MNINEAINNNKINTDTMRTEEKLDVNDSLPPTEMFENNTCKDTKI